MTGTANRLRTPGTREGGGALDRFRAGTWRRVDGGALAVPATVAIVLDALTTYHVLAASGYREFNAVVTAVGAGRPSLGVAYLLVHGGMLAVAAWLSLGWVSTFSAAFAVTTHGIAGGVSNLLLFATGGGLYSVLPVSGSLGYLLATIACLALALTTAVAVDGQPPIAEAVVVLAWFLGGIALAAGLI